MPDKKNKTMAQNSTISWTNHTFNAWIGCTKISPGCKFCYAEAYAQKYRLTKWGDAAQRRLTANSTWDRVLAWDRKAKKQKTRYRVFCSSLSDVMEDNLQLEQWRIRLWKLIDQTPNLDWLILTKRPDNYSKFLPSLWKNNFPKNVWLGTTICTQAEYNDNYLPFAQFQKDWSVETIFVSFEPLLENIKLIGGAPNWSIIGGESGFLKNARKMELRWVQNLIMQIDMLNAEEKKHHVFFKQFGSQLAKILNFADKKGEAGIDLLPQQYDWLKRREIPFENNPFENNVENLLF
jgi:protein gp37